MRIFGRGAETELERERRERHEAEHRRNRDAAGNARQRALDAEAERKREWQRIQSEGHAQQQVPDSRHSRWSPSGRPADDSPDARTVRAEAVRRAGEVEQERRQQYQSLRTAIVQGATEARAAKAPALATGDIDGYVAAHGRLQALESMLAALDAGESDRRRLGSAPVVPHAAPLR